MHYFCWLHVKCCWPVSPSGEENVEAHPRKTETGFPTFAGGIRLQFEFWVVRANARFPRFSARQFSNGGHNNYRRQKRASTVFLFSNVLLQFPSPSARRRTFLRLWFSRSRVFSSVILCFPLRIRDLKAGNDKNTKGNWENAASQLLPNWFLLCETQSSSII